MARTPFNWPSTTEILYCLDVIFIFSIYLSIIFLLKPFHKYIVVASFHF